MKSIFKKITALILTLAVAFGASSVAFALEEENSLPQEANNDEIIARLYVCSSMSVPVLVGHVYLYVENLSDEPITVGLYEVPAGQGVSVGTMCFSVSDGGGIYYNVEAYRINKSDKNDSVLCKSKDLTKTELERLSQKLSGALNHWDIVFNCSYFAYTIWNDMTGDFVVPLIIPILSHAALAVSGGRSGIQMYSPDRTEVFRQHGSGSGATLELVSDATLKM